MSKTIVEALKKLCVKVKNDGTTVNEIEASNIVECLDILTESYTTSTAGTLGELTLSSVAGSTVGTTKITVEGASSGAIFKYKATSNLPAYQEDLSDWNDWDGVSDIEADDTSTVCVCEVDENNLAYKGGTVVVSVNAG